MTQDKRGERAGRGGMREVLANMTKFDMNFLCDAYFDFLANSFPSGAKQPAASISAWKKI